LVFAFVFIGILTTFNRGSFLPLDAGNHAWLWLSLSGIVGFVLGDLFLFASYPLITSRIAMLMMTLVPPVTAVFGWVILDEQMSLLNILGMIMVVSGIGITIWSRGDDHKFKMNHSMRGIVYAFIGAIGQAFGLILSKHGMKDYNAFAATHIRIIAGIVGFIIIISVLKKWKNVSKTLTDIKAMKSISIGSFFGPFLGVSFSLIAVQNTVTGIASTIMAIVPVLIIPPAIIFFKQKVSKKEIIGAVISVIGVVLFFI